MPGHAKMCLMPYANNKGADQPVHPRSVGVWGVIFGESGSVNQCETKGKVYG